MQPLPRRFRPPFYSNHETRPWNPDPYTRITHYTHDTHTIVSYGAFTLYATASTYFYNGSAGYVAALYNVFAGCVLPPWEVWLCGSGPVNIFVQPNPVQVRWTGPLTSAPPWYPYSGTQYTGYYSFS
jgi:hypothetical protein